MHKYYFTFGFGHHHGSDYQLLRNHYTIIEAESEQAARQQMCERRGNKWATSYDSPEAAGVEWWELIYIPFTEVRAQDGPTF
jgi:hypothetical protein